MSKIQFGKKSKRISLAAMFTAFTLIFLYLACVLPVMRMTMYFISSFFVAGLVVEEEYGFSWLLFIVCTALSFLIMPDITRVVPYALFFGHFGIVKHFIEKKLRDKFLAYIVKLLYFNAALVGTYFLASATLLADIPFSLPIWALALIANVVFALFDFVYSKATQYYYSHIRKWLVK